MDPLQWMGAVRMRVQTADKNITIIHTPPDHQWTSWDKNWNKSSIKMLCFWLKCESIMHNNAPSCYLLHQNTSTYLFQAIFGFLNTAWSVQISLLIHWWLFHWRKQYLYTELLFTNNWIVSFIFCRCSLMDWSGVDHCDVLIIGLDSHSDGTHSLKSIHCWTSDGRLHFSKSEAAANSSWMAWNYVWLNYSFKRISPKEWKLSLFTDWFMYHNPFLWLIFSPMSVHVVVTTVSDSHKPESGKIKHVCHIHISREESKKRI